MSVAVRSVVASSTDTASALASLDAQLNRGSSAADFIFAFYGDLHDDIAIADYLAVRFPGTPLVGGTSHGGVMSEIGLGSSDSIGLLLISDREGLYGVASAVLDGDREHASLAAEGALHEALHHADADGELPEVIWVFQAPGQEEAVLDGIRRVVGDRCPVVGGSSAAESMVGRWRQLGPDGPMTNGLVIGVLFPSRGVTIAYQGGYEPTGHSGIVTEVGTGPDAGRRIVRIDDAPAADMCRAWRNDAQPGSESAAAPWVSHKPSSTDDASYALGVEAGTAGEVTYFQLIEARETGDAGVITLRADVTVGTRVFLMRGRREGLIRRAGRVVSAAMSSLEGERGEPAGGLVVYCAGCRIIVGDAMGQVGDALSAAFVGHSFLGCFTGGEVGPALGCNVHANLMVSAIVFGR